MSQSPISPRPATEDDIPSVSRIEKASNKHPWTASQFTDELIAVGSTFIVLTDDETDEIVSGYIVYRELIGETHVLNVAVDSKQRRRGWGRRLVGFAVNDAYRKGHERVFLEVRASNAAATALYSALGFVEAGRRKGFYSDGEEAIFMELRLKDATEDSEPSSNTYH